MKEILPKFDFGMHKTNPDNVRPKLTYSGFWRWFDSTNLSCIGVLTPPNSNCRPLKINGVWYWYDRNDKIKEMLKS